MEINGLETIVSHKKIPEIMETIEFLSNPAKYPEMQQSAFERMEILKNDKDFHICLAYIVSTPSITGSIKTVSVILLKNLVDTVDYRETIQYVLKAGLEGLKSSEKDLRSACSSLIAVIFKRYQIDTIIIEVLSNINIQDDGIIQASLITMTQILEDSHAIKGAILNGIYNEIKKCLLSDSSLIREAALDTLNALIPHRPSQITDSPTDILSVLDLHLLKEENIEVRVHLCTFCRLFVEYYEKESQSVFGYISERMVTSFENIDVMPIALEACEFFLDLAEKPSAMETIIELLDKIIPAVLRATLTESISLRDDDDWSLRKASALLIDTISVNLPSNIFFPAIRKKLKEVLNSTDWRVKEAGLLVLGAIVESIDPQYMRSYLETIFEAAQEENRLIRKTAIWCIERFDLWICRESITNKVVIDKALGFLLIGMKDSNVEIRRRSVLALCQYGERDIKYVEQYIETIQNSLVEILPWDVEIRQEILIAIGEYAGSIHKKEIKERYSQVVMGPLLQAWDNEEEMLSYIIDAVFLLSISAVKDSKEEVWRRIKRVFNSFITEDSDVYHHDTEEAFQVSGCIGILGKLMKYDLFTNNQENVSLISYVAQKGSYSSPTIKQASFSLIGDLCFMEMGAGLLTQETIQNIGLNITHIDEDNEDLLLVSNNAVWAFCQIICSGILGNEENIKNSTSFIGALIGTVYNSISIPVLFETVCVSIGRVLLRVDWKKSELFEIDEVLNIWCKNITEGLESRNKEIRRENNESVMGVCKYCCTNEVNRDYIINIINTLNSVKADFDEDANEAIKRLAEVYK
eukprot:GHVP01055322.1.p1 GENE.GHVP01055322.1~~GHVP01055322.1.p1  ORF type:complete len:808 (+),score=141.66 GHVP01055322.1:3-2426(+)